ncbi:hypothetical protein [uncultured Alteromonas sp.]|uniref:hypothetical protein n=1 Tax=uncultured Alteromonas sp. TaxID=179113 RepID=UPI0030D2616E
MVDNYRAIYASTLEMAEQATLQRDILSDVGIFLLLVVLLYLFEALSFRFVVAGGLGRKLIRVFLAPGVLLHELAHYVCAVLSGFSKVRLYLLPNNTAPNVLGHVVYSYKPSLLSSIGIVLTSLAPLPIGALALVGLLNLISYLNVSDVMAVPSLWDFDNFIEYISALTREVVAISWWQGVICVYLYIVISLTMMPSYQDIKVLLVHGLFVAVLIAILCVFVAMTPYTVMPIMHLGLMLLNKGLQICVSAAFIGLVCVLLITMTMNISMNVLSAVKR